VLAERPEDVVAVPLKFIRDDKTVDHSDTVNGTLMFSMNEKDRKKLQEMAKKNTETYLKNQRQPETRSFASDAQMLNCIPRRDLADLASNNYAGARETLTFRDTVEQQVAALEKLAGSGAGRDDPRVQHFLKSLSGLAESDQDRVAYVGRSLNRSGKLEAFLSASEHAGGDGSGVDVLNAGMVINDELECESTASAAIAQTILPLMARASPLIKEEILVLRAADAKLHRAKTKRAIAEAIKPCIDYYNLHAPTDFDPSEKGQRQRESERGDLVRRLRGFWQRAAN
jgi:hypothetical protein